MEHRTKRDIALINLVSNFESSFETGNVEYLDEKSYNQLVEYYEEEHNYEKALNVVSMALLQYEYRSDFYIAMARLLLKCHKIEESLSYLEDAEHIAPYENEIFFLRARAYAEVSDFDQAFIALQESESFLGTDDQLEYWLTEAFIFEMMKSYPEMYTALEKVLLEDGEIEMALDKVVVAAKATRCMPSCIKLLNKLIDRNPYNYLAWYNLGLAYTHTGDYENSIDALEYSFIINDEFEEGFMDCADMCCQVQKYNKAASIYEEAIETFGEDSDLLINLAECLIKIDRLTEAKHHLYKAIKFDHHNEEAFFLLGEACSKEGKWYRAINAYHKAIEIDEDCESFYLSLARAYLQVEEYNKATVNFQIAISFGPEQTVYWREFATFMIKLGLYEEAIYILDEAEDYTYGADLLYCRGVANLFLKDQRTAMENFEEALEEEFDGHGLIYELAPELEISREIKAMINYFRVK